MQSCEYTPYGEVASNTGTYNSPYKFTSKELDDTSGLYYYGARYYDAVLCHFIQADTIVPQPLNPQTLNRYSYCDNNPINYTDPTGHSWFSKIINKVEKAIEKAITWLEKVTGAEWDVDISAGGSVPFGPGGDSGSPSSSPDDGGSPSYNDYGYEYDPFFDPIVSPDPVVSQYIEPAQAQAPIPERRLLDITTEELGNLHVLSQIDPVSAKIQSGDFTRALDSVSTITEKIFVLNQISGNSTRPGATKTSLKQKASNFLSKIGSAYSQADIPKAGIALKVASLALSDAGPFEMAGRFGGGYFGGMIGSSIFGGLGALAGPGVAVPAAFWGGIFGASLGSEYLGNLGKKFDVYIATHWDRR